MLGTTSLHLHNVVKWLPPAMSGVAVVVGMLVLAGGGLKSAAFDSVVPGLAGMKANTALAFVLSGASLWLLRNEDSGRLSRSIGRCCAVIVGLIGLLTLGEYIVDGSIGTDELLFRDHAVSVGTLHPGRMSPLTALKLLLIGGALSLLDVEFRRRFRPSQWLALGVGFLSLLSLVGYAYDAPSLYKVADSASVALHTAFTFFVFSVGILFARPDRGLMKPLLSDGMGGFMARRMLPAAFFIPLVMDWLSFRGEQAGFYSLAFALALFATTNLVFFAGLIWWSARFLNQTDSKRQQAEEALRESEAHMRRVMDNMLAFVGILDPDGTLKEMNQTALTAGALTRSDVVGRKFWDCDWWCHSAEEQERLRASIARAAAGEVVRYDAVVRMAGDTRMTIDFMLAPATDDKGKITHVIPSGIDITERKQAEDRLRESEDRYRTLFDTMDEGFCIIEMLFDENGQPHDFRYLEINPAFEKQTGLERAAGKTARELTPSIEKTWFEFYGRVALTGQPDRIEIRAEELNRWFDVYASRIGSGDSRKVAVLFKDISERKRWQEDIEELNRSLEHKVLERTAKLAAVNTELESFSYSVSHDLRAPLRAIDGFSQALMEDCAGQLNVVGNNHLQRIRAAAGRMGDLIDALLSLGRLSRAELRRQQVDLSALAQAIADELRGREPQRGAEFVIQNGLHAQGDARLLRAVMENLLGNAWKFTAKQPRARIEFGARQENGDTVYFVRDDGAGFNMAFIGKLFGTFQRLHGMTEFAGNGIGLATVQRIIHQHGGRVWAEGAELQGATFYFTVGPREAS